MGIEFRVWNKTIQPQSWTAMPVIATTVSNETGLADNIAQVIANTVGRDVCWKFDDGEMEYDRFFQPYGENTEDLSALWNVLNGAIDDLSWLQEALEFVGLNKLADSIKHVVDGLVLGFDYIHRWKGKHVKENNNETA